MRATQPIKDLRTYPKKHVSPMQLAAYVGVTRRTIYHHIEKGALPVHKIGGVGPLRIRKSDALAYADEA